MSEICLPRQGENAYFVAANGYDGFRSYYTTVYRSESFARVFVIKGGPGTGKSRLMREVAVVAETIGADVDYIYCSSDPTSLDGVILRNDQTAVAILDGTAPHTRCAVIPGTIDELVNLGDFWDSHALAERRSEILALTKEKSARFSLAYSYLHIAGAAKEEREKLLLNAYQKEKAEKALLRFLKDKKENTGAPTRILYSGIGMRGEVFFPTLFREATDVVTVEDCFGFSRIFLSCAEELLRRSATSYVAIEDHLSPKDLIGLYLPKNKTLILNRSYLPVTRTPNKTFTASRFLDRLVLKKLRPDLRRIGSLYREALLSADAAFRSAGESHFALESIYMSTMNFKEKELLSLRLSKRILHLLSDKVDNSADM